MHRVSTEEIPFNLSYGIEVVSPIEVTLPSPHVDNIDLSTNEEQLRGNLNLLKKAKEAA